MKSKPSFRMGRVVAGRGSMRLGVLVLRIAGLVLVVCLALWQLQRSAHDSSDREHRTMQSGADVAQALNHGSLQHKTTSKISSSGSRSQRLGSSSGSSSSHSKPARRSCKSDACVDVDIGQVQRGSNVMYGLAWEDINNSGEGGLHVEMIRDWSFEARSYLRQYPALTEDTAKDLKPKPWPDGAPVPVRPVSGLQAASMDPQGVASHPLRDKEAWQLSGSGIREELRKINDEHGLHALCVTSSSVTVTWLTNKGHTLKGFAVEALVSYRLRMKVKGSDNQNIQVSLGDGQGSAMLVETTMSVGGGRQDDWNLDWRVLDTTLVPPSAQSNVFLHITWRGPGSLCLDWVSLTPKKSWSAGGVGDRLDTFHPRLMAALAALQPQFIRFPGGAFVEGTTLQHTYRWRKTVGPRELRPGHPNANWGYWSSDGLGLFEYMQLCDKLMAEPVWVVQAGVSQTESAEPEDLKYWIQENLDALEFLLGPSHSKYGKIRAEMGQVSPFTLKYITIGNEECRRPWYAEHFARIANALLDVHRDLRIISNCDLGSAVEGGGLQVHAWEFHSYKSPEEIFSLRQALDEYKGLVPVAVTEFAALGPNPVYNAVAEAGFMAALERNCHKAELIAYAPVMGHQDLMVWATTLLTFNGTRHWTPSPSYTIQQLFRQAWKGSCAQVDLSFADKPVPDRGVEASALCQGPQCSTLAIKIVNFDSVSRRVQLTVHPPSQGGLLHMKKKETVSLPETVKAQLLQLNPQTLGPQTGLLDEAASLDAILAEDEPVADGNALGLSGGLNAALKSIIQLNLNSVPVTLSVPAYSVTMISARVRGGGSSRMPAHAAANTHRKRKRR